MNSIVRRGLFLSLLGSAVCAWFCAAPAAAATTQEITKSWAGSVVVIRMLDADGKERSLGSGFVIGPERVATCYHVVFGGKSAEIKTADGITYPAKDVEAFDSAHDLAIIHVNKLTGITPITLADSSAVKLGQPVVALGAPLGLEASVSDGVPRADYPLILAPFGMGDRYSSVSSPERATCGSHSPAAGN